MKTAQAQDSSGGISDAGTGWGIKLAIGILYTRCQGITNEIQFATAFYRYTMLVLHTETVHDERPIEGGRTGDQPIIVRATKESLRNTEPSVPVLKEE